MSLPLNPTDNELMAYKDELNGLLNDADDDGEFLTAAETVLERLENVFHCFGNNSYAYKGREICGRIDRQLWDMTTHCNHARRLDRIARLRNTACQLERRYHEVEHARLFPAA